MTYLTKKRLLHFDTSGNIAEDFIAARHGKLRVLRHKIRVCFYIHSAAAAICIILAAVLGGVPDIIKIAACAVVSAVFSIFAAGGLGAAKIFAVTLDILLAAGGFVIFALGGGGLLYILCGCLMIAGAASLCVMIFFCNCKKFLEEYSPLSIRREDYTLINEVGYKIQSRVQNTTAAMAVSESVRPKEDEVLPPLPPLNTEMRELARQACTIILTPPKKQPENVFRAAPKNSDFYNSDQR